MEIPNNYTFTDETETSSDNFSNHDKEGTYEPEFTVPFFLLLALSGLTVFTNAFILASFYVEKKLRTYTNCYIFNMTIADLVVGLVVMPLRCSITLYNTWIFGRVPSILFLGLQNSLLSVSVCGVIVISVDRYIATFYPIKHFQRRSIRKANIINIGTWIFSFAVWMMVTSGWDFIEPSEVKVGSGLWRSNFASEKYSVIVVSVFRMPVPCLIIAGFYIRIYFRVRNSGSKHVSARSNKEQINASSVSQYEDQATARVMASSISTEESEIVTIPSISSNVLSHSKPNDDSKNANYCDVSSRSTRDHISPSLNRVSKKHQGGPSPEGQKALRTLTFIIIAFFASWLPNILHLMVYTISIDFYKTINIGGKFNETSRWMSYCNSLVNPVAYAMAQPLIRQTVLKIIRCRRCS